MADELSREALLIYLENLRVLETLAVDTEQKKRLINEQFIKRKGVLEPRQPIQPNRPYRPVYTRRDGEAILVESIMLVVFILCGLGGGLMTVGSVIMSIIFIFLIIKSIIEWNQAKTEYRNQLRDFEFKNEEYTRAMQQYENKCREYDWDKKRAEQKKRELTDKVNQSLSICDREISDIKAILPKAYAANIIPVMFRDIHGVYYLYDYLSTSNETLTSALMQYNLETIKQKLDKVIELQGKAIIQQAKANAALYAQNQMILEIAQATMNNTAVAAQYAQIAAVNSAVSVKLQRQQLTYQEMEFWLK